MTRNAATPNNTDNTKTADPIPHTIRWGGYFGIVQGSLGIIAGIALLLGDLLGHDTPGVVISGYGTALWFFLVFGAILAGGIALLKGKALGRGPIIFFQLALLGVAYYMATSSRWEFALPTVVIALLGLGLMFHPDSVNWMAQRYASGRTSSKALVQ